MTTGWSRRSSRTGAQLIVLDPIQAYLGDGVDMHRANEVRPVLKRVAAMAERTGCAVILIGHMNKAQGLKSGYRGLGSIDFRAAARSVLVVGRLKEDPTVRVVAQDKNSLAPEGKSIAFLLDGEHGFQWKGACDLSVDDVLSGGGRLQTKTTQMEEELERMLTETTPAEAVLKPGQRTGGVGTHPDDRQEKPGRHLGEAGRSVVLASAGARL